MPFFFLGKAKLISEEGRWAPPPRDHQPLQYPWGLMCLGRDCLITLWQDCLNIQHDNAGGEGSMKYSRQLLTIVINHTGVKIFILMARIQKIRHLAFKLFPLDFFWKIVKNLNFTIWKKVFLNFIGAPRLNPDR